MLASIRERPELRWLLAPGRPLELWLESLARLQIVDRGAGLGAQAFSALLPLVIVYGSVAPTVDARGFARHLIASLHLSGIAAQGVRAALTPPSEAGGGVTVIGFALLLVSTLTFARALQRMYEVAYGLPKVGVRGTPWHLMWIALIPVYLSVRPLLAALGDATWDTGSSLMLGAFAWLVTPCILLARRLHWRRLVPGALFSAVGMSALSGAAVIYLPHSLATSAKQFGPIGIAFGILGWLILAGYVLIACTAAGVVTLAYREPSK